MQISFILATLKIFFLFGIMIWQSILTCVSLVGVTIVSMSGHSFVSFC